jgi:hypothetical protein
MHGQQNIKKNVVRFRVHAPQVSDADILALSSIPPEN